MAVKTKFEEFISDMKSITQMPMFTLSPAKKIDREEGEVKKEEKVKTKLLEAWNNIRYDLGPIATLKKDMPIWILGVCHHSRSGADLTSEEAEEEDSVFDSPLDRRIHTDFASRPRFTYRKNFPAISGTDITTDTGWGCMLRSAQMMIAQGLMFHFLGREWRWLTNDVRREKVLHKEIIGWFIDDPTCPLSIHRLCEIGKKFGNLPGDWYGPNTSALIMRRAVKEAQEKYHKLREVAVYVAVDCTVYSEDVYDLCGWRESAVDCDETSSAKIHSATSSGQACKEETGKATESSSHLGQNTVTCVKTAKENEHEGTSKAPNNSGSFQNETMANKIDKRNDLRTQELNSPDDGNMQITVLPEINTQTEENMNTNKIGRSESWCEVTDVISSESYENFKKFHEPKKKQKKSRFGITKTKKGKISLYNDDNEPSNSRMNGRTIMPHFQVGTPALEIEHLDSQGRNIADLDFSILTTSKKANKLRKSRSIESGDDIAFAAKNAVLVTPETPSPILFRRANSQQLISVQDVLHSPNAIVPKLSFFKWDNPPRRSAENDTFLSSYIEPPTPDQISHEQLRSPTVNRNNMTSQFRHSNNSATASVNQSKQTKLNSNEHSLSHDCVISSAVNFTNVPQDGNESDSALFSLRRNDIEESPSRKVLSQPVPIASPNTRDKPISLRRTSSTPRIRPHSCTIGESPISSHGSLKLSRKPSVPTTKVGQHKAALILIPVRLGECALNPIYAPCVEAMLSLESSIGIIGGRPKHSLYFVGCQGSSLLHLDPHYCQPADTPIGYTKNLHDYHTTQIRKVNVKKMDPSCCLGFYCRTPEEFEEFKVQSRKNFTPPHQSLSYPMCLIMEGRRGAHEINTSIVSPDQAADSSILTKNTSLPMAVFDDGIDVGDHSSATVKNSKVAENNDMNVAKVKKKKAETFSMDDVSSTLNKLNPLAKLMRNKSPAAKRKNIVANEELESQFELL